MKPNFCSKEFCWLYKEDTQISVANFLGIQFLVKKRENLPISREKKLRNQVKLLY